MPASAPRPPIIDADSHFMEVHDSWTKYLDKRFWDRRFDVVEDAGGLTWLTVGDRRINTIGRMDPGTIAEEGKAAAEARARGKLSQGRSHDAADGPTYMESLQPGSYQPGPRVAMLDAMGIDKQLIFPTHGLVLVKQLWDDIPALCANLSAYNRWVAEFNSAAPDRLFGVGHLTLEDPAWAAAEVRRCAAAGIRAIVVPPASTTRDVPIFHASHDPVWRAFVECDIAVCFHIQSHKRLLTPEWYDGDDAVHHKVMDLVFMHLPVAATLTALIVHGKLEQFAAHRRDGADRPLGAGVAARARHQRHLPRGHRWRRHAQAVVAPERVRAPAGTGGAVRLGAHRRLRRARRPRDVHVLQRLAAPRRSAESRG